MPAGIDAVSVMAAYQPLVQAYSELHACTTDCYVAITSTASIPTGTEKPYSVVLAKDRTW